MTRIIQAYGSPRGGIGDVLSIAVPGAVTGGSPPITYTNQWQVNGVSVPNATGDTFTVLDEHLGRRITCVTTATDNFGRRLILAPSNEILIGKPGAMFKPQEPCPKPTRKVCCPTAPPLLDEPPKEEIPCEPAKVALRKSLAAAQGKTTRKPVATPDRRAAPAQRPAVSPQSTPSIAQIKREMRKAGGCRSCGGRRRRS